MKRYALNNKIKLQLARVIDLFGKPIGWLSQAPSAADPSKILILQLDHIGDVLFAVPAIESIRKRFPKSQIIAVVGKWAKPVLMTNPDLNEVIEFNAPWFDREAKTSQLKGLQDLGRLLKSIAPDIVIDFRGDLRHNITMFLAKIPARIGFGITGGGFLLTNEIDYPFESHAVLRHMAIPEAFGNKFEVSDIKMKLHLSKAEKDWAEQFLKAHKLKGRTLIGIHPETGTQAKQWPTSSFVRTMDLLAGKLADKNPLFIFTGLKPFGLNSSNVIDLGGKLSLRQLAALQSKLDLFICGDTGPLHMANALGCPTVALYSGTNDVKIWGPWGGKVKVLQVGVNCAPCGKSVCSDKQCMTSITPKMALSSSLELLA